MTYFPLAPSAPPHELGPQLPRAVADENTLPNGKGAVIPHEQEVKDFVRHPGVKKQPPGVGGQCEIQGQLDHPQPNRTASQNESCPGQAHLWKPLVPPQQQSPALCTSSPHLMPRLLLPSTWQRLLSSLHVSPGQPISPGNPSLGVDMKFLVMVTGLTLRTGANSVFQVVCSGKRYSPSSP
jgi:hypothetical protein